MATIFMRSPVIQNQSFPVLTLSDIDSDEGLCSGFYTITALFAERILQTRNQRNRPLSRHKMGQLCSDMANGDFRTNGESIIFDSSGNLSDGQHRLTACQSTGKSIVANVVFGVMAETQKTVDQGKGRNAGDAIHLEGHKNGNIVAAIARGVIAYESGDGQSIRSHNKVTSQGVYRRLDENPHIYEIATWASKHSRNLRGICTASHIGIARAILEPIFGPEVVEYLDRVAVGDMLAAGDPAFAVRHRLFSDKRTSMPEAVEAIFRGALAHMEGRQLSRVNIDGRFPKLK